MKKFIVFLFCISSLYILIGADILIEGFESGSFPPGWTNNSSYVNGGNSHTGTYKAGMNAANDWIQLPDLDYPGYICFWVRTSSDPDNWVMKVQENIGSGWVDVYTVTENGVGGEISDVYSDHCAEINENQTDVQIRFLMESRSLGSCYLDDVLVNEYGDGPCPVVLSTFTAEYNSEILAIHWTTASETNNQGWNVYRADIDNYEQATKINASLIPGYDTTFEPHDYTFVDKTDYVDDATYYYWIESNDNAGNTHLFGSVSVEVPQEQDNPIPPPIEEFGLYQNYPNPFNPETTISFTLQETSDVELIIYNVRGQKVATLFKGNVDAKQTRSFIWNSQDNTGKEVSSGIYMYKLITNDKTYMKKMLLVK